MSMQRPQLQDKFIFCSPQLSTEFDEILAQTRKLRRLQHCRVWIKYTNILIFKVKINTYGRRFGFRGLQKNNCCPKKTNTNVLQQLLPDHALFDGRRFFGYFDRFHVEKDRMLLVGFWLRQQRMKQDSTSRVDQESVGQLCKTKVNDGTEQSVQRYIDTRNALKFTKRGHR